MTSEARTDAIDRAERILRTRIDEFGVEEPHTANRFYKSGRVGNTETGEALSGVIITVPDLGIQTITDLEGRFQISGSLPNGRYRLKAERVGYEVLEGEMVVPGRSEFLVLLTPTETRGLRIVHPIGGSGLKALPPGPPESQF